MCRPSGQSDIISFPSPGLPSSHDAPSCQGSFSQEHLSVSPLSSISFKRTLQIPYKKICNYDLGTNGQPGEAAKGILALNTDPCSRRSQ